MKKGKEISVSYFLIRFVRVYAAVESYSLSHSIRADASARNLLDNLGITELLNRNGVSEVMINRPYELFVESSSGTERVEHPELALDKLRG